MTHQQLKEKMIAEFVEEGAALEHARWAKWQTYLHSRCVENLDGSLTIPAELVSRWQRQIATTYEELSEIEKESDRKQVQDYIPLLSHAMDEAVDAQLTRSAINVIHKGKIGKIFFNFNETQRKEIIANVKKLLEQTD